MKSWLKYAVTVVVGATVMAAAYFLPMETFQAFVIGWLFLIPATFAVYMLFGLREYLQERKNRIFVSIKPTEAMKALARKEAALEKEKELLYEELQK
jgi:purine-cytosine permease-like protein